MNAPGSRGVRFAGTGVALPPGVLTNDDLAKRVDTSDEWITQRTGIKQRHIADEHTTARDLARQALLAALDDADLKPTDLDLVLVATITPEMTCPSTAARLVDEIGATPAGAMDLTAACAGFVYGLNLAAPLIQTGQYQRIAIVGAEVLTKAVDFTDRRTCILFGDAAGATILEATDDPTQGCLLQTVRSDGGHWKHLYLPTDQTHLPEDPHERELFNGTLGALQMNGREVFKVAVQQTENIILETLDRAGLQADEIASFICHQSNARILELTRKRLDLPADKLPINIDRFGNTSAASIPLVMRDLQLAGQFNPGDLILFTGIGGGMCWATSLWKL
ncbi:MAG: beta-ketoacyl-ACP synthase III [Planctomycetota bacterium]